MKMYEVDSGDFTSKLDPKKEFIQYLRESGAAAALQKAIILLHRMPVKPENLAEFFSQYFENGAQQLIRISLLKAELCYKRDELEIIQAKVQDSESSIQRMIEALGITREEFESKYFPESIKKKNRFSELQRYFQDAETKHLVKSAEDDMISNNSCIRGTICSQEARVDTPEQIEMDEENLCVKNMPSDTAIRNAMKELDPWGIICKPRYYDRDDRKRRIDPNRNNDSDELTDADGEYEQEEEDAASLAELFQQASKLNEETQTDESIQKLHNQLLTVRQADGNSVRDFMGWSPLRSREDLSVVAPQTEDVEFMFSERKDVESLKQRRPCAQIPVMVEGTSPEVENDAFLLDDDNFEQVYKMMETTQESFEYEFKRHARVPRTLAEKRDVCKPICELVDKGRLCRGMSGRSLREHQGEGGFGAGSLGFIPGKMENWTSLCDEYPGTASQGEYFDIPGEDGVRKSAQSIRHENFKIPQDVPLSRMDSSCHCVLTGAYDINEMISESTSQKQLDRKSVNGQDKDGRKLVKRDGKTSIVKDTGTLTEDAVLENELQEVFKSKQHQKSMSKDKYKKETEIEEETHSIDVFNIDLTREVKRMILGIKPSETDTAQEGNLAYKP